MKRQAPYLNIFHDPNLSGYMSTEFQSMELIKEGKQGTQGESRFKKK
jgi:hypothetical protein